ncbi:MAG: hypothetical protein WC205_03150 [Opitutaceae bacterium]|jgi:hypothetical protein
MSLLRYPHLFVSSCLLALLLPFAAPAQAEPTTPAPGASWIWDSSSPADHSTRYLRKTIRLDTPVKSAVVPLSCDDIAELFVNGAPYRKNSIAWLNQPTIQPKRFDLADLLVVGRNVIAIKADNHTGPAGVIALGDIVLESGDIVTLKTDATWKVSASAAADWSAPAFDDSAWSSATLLGPPDMRPWVTLTDISKFESPRYISTDSRLQGRVMIDDFADISSWLGGAIRGNDPAATAPFYFGMGSVPDARRDDGYAGALDFIFIEDRGEARFEKNSAYLMPVMPSAIGFSADAEGHSGEVSFSFADALGREHRTQPVRIEGNGWQDHLLTLGRGTFANFDAIKFPVHLRHVHLRVDKAASGRVLLDDLYYLADISDPARQLAIHPEYSGLVQKPGAPVHLGFRVRNGLSTDVDAALKLNIYDANNRLVRTAEKHLPIPRFGLGKVAFDLPGFAEVGPYRIELAANNATARHTFDGWLAVFEPNGKRVNTVPMWFGIEDQEINTYKHEARLHAEWMKLLGVDLQRSGLMGSRAERVRGTTLGYKGVSEMWEPYDGDIMILLDYASGMPSWLFPPGQKTSDMPSDHTLLAEHFTRIAELMAAHPQVRYFEWLNEPDLDGYTGTTDEYIASLRVLYPIVKRIAPRVKVTTGGLVVGTHPSAKKDFTRRVYQEASDSYDVAAFHAHDDYDSYKKYHETMETWMRAAGVPPKKTIANTEAGYRSYHGASRDGGARFLNQARALVQKISYARAKGSEFYVWFMLQDYWDKYINADDSFGLVTVDNQAKPAFIAYNELIRQLANTRPGAPLRFDERLDGYHFETDREDVFVCWPAANRGTFTFAIKTSAPLEMIDIWGNRTAIKPERDMAYITATRLPFYLRSPRGAITPAQPLVSTTGGNVFAPGEKRTLTAVVANPYDEAVVGTLTADGRAFEFRLSNAGSTQKIEIPVEVPATEKPAARSLLLEARLKTVLGAPLFSGEIALPYYVCLPVPETAAQSATIILDTVDKVRELAFDPLTPRWSGPEDLSARIGISRQRDGIAFEFVVSDQDQSFTYRDAYIWRNDCIQIGFLNECGGQTEITLSSDADGKLKTWCHLAPDKTRIGEWRLDGRLDLVPVRATYRFTVPYSSLGLGGRPGELFKMAIVISDNDGGKRLRVMEWGGGIEGGKNADLYNWVQLK